MAVIDFKRRMLRGGCGVLLGLVSGCGLTQSVGEGAASLTKSIFYKTITTLRLDFSTRSALNTDEDTTPLAVVVRVYQLKDRKTIDSASYEDLLKNDSPVLQQEIVAQQDVVLKPSGTASLTMPLDADTQYVAVIGLFRSPDAKGGWKQVIEREALDPDKPRRLEVGDGSITLLALTE